MILDSLVKIKGNSKNLKYYRSLGYALNVGEFIFIDIEHLSHGSTFKVKVECDICKIIKEICWSSLYKYLSGDINNEYFCSNCNSYKRNKTNNIKYGGNSPTCDPEIIKKMQNTNLEKWGSTCTLQSEKMKPIIKEIFIKKYGVDNPLKNKEVQSKYKTTLIKKYGVESPLKNKDIYNKLIKTNLEKYGVENVFENEEIKKIITDKQIENWGMIYVKTQDMKQKSKQTSIKNWGTEYYAKSIDSFKKNILKKTSKYPNINFISYNDIEKEYNILCDNCGIVYGLHNDLIYHRIKNDIELCTNCNPIGQGYVSSGEKNISKFLANEMILFSVTNQKLISPYHLDIVIDNLKVAIEYNGIYWHNDQYKSKLYHNMKYNKCLDIGWNLLQIWEDDWIFKTEIVKSIILSKLNIYKNKIFARNCQIKIVNNKDKSEFLNINHLQGSSKSNINIGLYHDDKLVSLMTFGRRRINSKENFELIRFCNILNTIIIGGASKLFKYFLNNYKYDKIVSYSDNSISSGNIYKILNFKFISTSINYYWCDGKIRYHRFIFNKKKLVNQGFDPNLTEVEIMRNRGFSRIWGAGNKKWEFDFE